jgi:xanthine dehydrogenase accessory factor
VVTDPLEAARTLIVERRSGALITGLAHGGRALIDESGVVIAGHLDASLLEQIRPEALALVRGEQSGTVAAVDEEFFVEVITPQPRLLIFGAGPIAEALCAMATLAGFSVLIGDPRPAFANTARFSSAAAVMVGWPEQLVAEMVPDRSSYAVSLLHEARFEDALLPALLESPAKYIGALGSRGTHAARVERLRTGGFSEDDMARIHGPVGLDIGAVSPEEIAVAILAEMVSVRRGGTDSTP